jgi:hypothetical protein
MSAAYPLSYHSGNRLSLLCIMQEGAGHGCQLKRCGITQRMRHIRRPAARAATDGQVLRTSVDCRWDPQSRGRPVPVQKCRGACLRVGLLIDTGSSGTCGAGHTFDSLPKSQTLASAGCNAGSASSARTARIRIAPPATSLVPGAPLAPPARDDVRPSRR